MNHNAIAMVELACREWCGCERPDDEHQQFREHLQRASEIVATWPEWKRGCLVSTAKSTMGEF